MVRQGRHFREDQLHKIVTLLASTDLSMTQIAERMGCDRSRINAINRKLQIRKYAGNRTRWIVSVEYGRESR